MKSRRFDAKTELKEYFNRDPGPGEYGNLKNAVDETNSENFSKKGMLNGFVSKADRF